jgi:hypothetical protein
VRPPIGQQRDELPRVELIGTHDAGLRVDGRQPAHRSSSTIATMVATMTAQAALMVTTAPITTA